MINSFKLLNYNDKLYKVFIEERTLYINFLGKTKVISQNVLEYCFEYFDESIWVSFYKKDYTIYLVEILINNNEDIKINRHLVIDTIKYANRIDSLTMIIKNKQQINLIFRGWYRDKSFIFNGNISICNNFNIISDNSLKNYNKPFITYSDEDKAMILICEKNEFEEYILYNILDDNTENSFLLPNTRSISFVKYEEKAIIFYNKKINNDLYIKYRYIDINEKNEGIEGEQELKNIPSNIVNPKISFYMGIMYLVWRNKNGIKSAISKNLKEWDISYGNENGKEKIINTNIIKVVDNRVEKINTYMKSDIVYNLIINKEKYREKDNNYQLMELLFYENSLNNKLKNINNMISIKQYYDNRYEEYLSKIRELNNIISEKDKLIYKLLSQK